VAFIFFVTIFFSGMLSYGALAYTFWQSRSNPLSRRLAYLCAVIAATWFLELVAQAFGYEVRPKYTTGFAVTWWISRTMKAVAPVWLLLWMLKRRA
jgi:hypothetical protein